MNRNLKPGPPAGGWNLELTKYLKFIFLLLTVVLLLASCQSVKPYQRVYLNDYNMKLGKKAIRGFGEKALTYREGSAGGGTGKSSGGCGCN